MRNEVLIGKLNSIFDDAWIEAEPETIWQELADANITVTQELKDKIGALKVLKSNDQFWQDVPTFEKIVLALNDVTPIFGRHQEYPLSYLVYVVEDVGEKEKYGPDVLRYMAGQFVKEGVYFNPWFREVNQYIKEFIKNETRVVKIINVLTKYFKTKDKTILTLNESIQLNRLRKVNFYMDKMRRNDGG